MPGTLFIISAASGTGKTSLVQALIQDHPSLILSISHTTRTPRTGELDGINYHFTNRTHFEEKIVAGEFLEHAEVFGNWYGTSRTLVEQSLSFDRDVLLEIDWQGAAQIKSLFPEAVSIFLLPPSLQALEQRLRSRGKDSEAVIRKRLDSAMADMSHYEFFDFVVINDQFEQALAELNHITMASRLRTLSQRRRFQDIIQKLLKS